MVGLAVVGAVGSGLGVGSRLGAVGSGVGGVGAGVGEGVSLAVAPDGRKTNAEMNITNKSRRRSVDIFMVQLVGLNTAQCNKMREDTSKEERKRKAVTMEWALEHNANAAVIPGTGALFGAPSNCWI